MAVAFDADMTGGNSADGENQIAAATATISSTGMTVGASATLLIGMLSWGAQRPGPTSPTMTWDGVSMTLQPSVTRDNGSNTVSVAIFTLANPAIGNKTLAAAWTNTLDVYMGAVSFTGANGVNASDNVTATDATSINVNTGVGDATVAIFLTNGSTPTMNQTTIWGESSLQPGGGGSYALGGSGSNSHTFTGAGGTIQALAGIHILSATAANQLAWVKA